GVYGEIDSGFGFSFNANEVENGVVIRVPSLGTKFSDYDIYVITRGPSKPKSEENKSKQQSKQENKSKQQSNQENKSKQLQTKPKQQSQPKAQHKPQPKQENN